MTDWPKQRVTTPDPASYDARQRNVGDGLYARTVAALGSDGVIDLVGTLGYDTLISLSINIFKVSPPAGAPCEFS